MDNWAKEHETEWVCHIPYQAPASVKLNGTIEWYNGLLKTKLRATAAGTVKCSETPLGKYKWLVNTRGSAYQSGPAQSKLMYCTR